MGCSGDSMGGNHAVMAKYHVNNCSNKGTLRVNSTCTVHKPLTNTLRDMRPSPTKLPSTVASRMPGSATRKVLDKPTA